MNYPLLSPIPSQPADYTVALITNADDETVENFINTQAYLGASEFIIYMDRPYKKTRFEQFSNVRIFPSSVGHEGEPRPDFFELQRLVYQHAYQRAKHAWLAVMDTDEAIFHPTKDLKSFLQSVPEDVTFVRAVTHEAIWARFSQSFVPFSATHARQAAPETLPQNTRRSIFGKFAKTLTKKGTVGHSLGKYLVRTGHDYKARIHFVQNAHQRFILETPEFSIALLHYDADSYPGWFKGFGSGLQDNTPAEKQLPHRLGIISQMQSKMLSSENTNMFHRLYCVHKNRMKMINQHTKIFRVDPKWASLFASGNADLVSVLKYVAHLRISVVKWRIQYLKKLILGSITN